MEQIITVNPPAAVAVPTAGAGIWRRGGGQVIDLIIHYIIGMLIGLFIGVIIGIYSVAAGISPQALVDKVGQQSVPSVIFTILGYILYHTLCEGLHGATLGKLALGMHVVTEQGQPCGLGKAFIRSIGWIADTILLCIPGLIAMSSSDLRQRLGDRWARTVVIERSKYPQIQFPSGGKFAWAFLAGITVDALMILLALVANIVL